MMVTEDSFIIFLVVLIETVLDTRVINVIKNKPRVGETGKPAAIEPGFQRNVLCEEGERRQGGKEGGREVITCRKHRPIYNKRTFVKGKSEHNKRFRRETRALSCGKGSMKSNNTLESGALDQ